MSEHHWSVQTRAGVDFMQFAGRQPQDTLLVFDFDGTLSRIVARPGDARMVEESALALARLGEAGASVAIISGRPVETLLELSGIATRPGLARAKLYGQYGAERLDLATGERSALAAPEGVGAAKEQLVELARRYSGASVEDKGLAVALHLRNVVDAQTAFSQVEDRVRQIAAQCGLTVEPGRYVWELRGTSVTKGDALTELVSQVRPVAVAFAGDDLGDLAAFDALARIGGQGLVTCAVVSASAEAPQLTERADVLCDGPDGIAAWLEALAEEVEEESGR